MRRRDLHRKGRGKKKQSGRERERRERYRYEGGWRRDTHRHTLSPNYESTNETKICFKSIEIPNLEC